jgi:hypothetical protein
VSDRGTEVKARKRFPCWRRKPAAVAVTEAEFSPPLTVTPVSWSRCRRQRIASSKTRRKAST